MAFEILETVEIKNGDGFLRINKRDFDPEKHTLFDADESAIEESMPEAVAPKDKTQEADRATRQEELETESWQTLKALAAELKTPITEKPEGGWDEVIPAILAEEFVE